jgi:hypothetical protein
MKAISIRQPYASLVVAGIKNIENRTWATRYRGPLAICASKAMSADDVRFERKWCLENGIPFPEPLLRGGIIGIVDLVGIFRPTKNHENAAFDRDGVLYEMLLPSDQLPDSMDWYVEGAIGWVLANPRPVEFVPHPGRLGLFEVPDQLIKIEDMTNVT